MTVSKMKIASPFSLLLCLVGMYAASISAASIETFNLSPFSFLMTVTKEQHELVEFQDSIRSSIGFHLTNYFQKKVEVSDFGVSEVRGVELSGSFVWKELHPELYNATGGNEYEVRSSFTSHVEVNYDSESYVEMLLTQEVVDMMIIEAFEGDNYWKLVHSFMADEVLEDISDIQVTIYSEGYVANNTVNTGAWTPGMVAGICLAIGLCVALFIMWAYLFCFVKGAPFLKYRYSLRRKFMEKAESVTDDMYSTNSLDSDEDDDTAWLDEWADSITSIQIREIVRPKRSRKRNIQRHPGQHHRSCLHAIEEDDDECSSVASIESYISKHRQRLAKVKASLDSLERSVSSSHSRGMEPPSSEMTETERESEMGTIREIC